MTTAVLEPIAETPRKAFQWNAMLAFLTEPGGNIGAALLQRNSLTAEATGDASMDTLLGVIGQKAATKVRMHKLADQEDGDF